jgi:hypothetical protein
MVIKSWGPLFGLLVLFGTSLFGLLVVEHPEPHNRGQPTIPQYKDSRSGELAATHAFNQYGEKGKQESRWIEQLFDKPTDTLLVIFNGFLVLFTYFLYRATAGLFIETAELRRIANEQREDLLRSIIAAETAADAAVRSNEHNLNVFTTDQRPWIAVEIISIESDFVRENDAISLSLKYSLKNTGKTPAAAVQFVATMEPLLAKTVGL